MNSYSEKIKRKIQIIIIVINIISFMIMMICNYNNKGNYNEYTNLSKLFSNFYIIIIFLIMLLHSISPNLICNIVSDNLKIITNSKAKIILIFLIGILFWNSDNFPHIIFGLINLISFIVLICCEIIIGFIINKNSNENKKINNEQIITNEKNISNEKEMNINFIINKDVSKNKKVEKNESDVHFFDKITNKDDYFQKIKNMNIKDQKNK